MLKHVRLLLLALSAPGSEGQCSFEDFCPNADATAPPKPERVQTSTIPLPPEVLTGFDYSPKLWQPQYVDEDHIVFPFASTKIAGQHVAYMREDGTDFKCLTCSLGTAINVSRVWVVGDGKRLLVSRYGNSDVSAQCNFFIFECMDGLRSCRRPQLVNISLPHLETCGMQDREPRVSRSGDFLAWTRWRLDGFWMLMGRLVRTELEGGEAVYNVLDTRVINPKVSLSNRSLEDWKRLGAWYEAKMFTQDGLHLIFGSSVGTSLNLDDYMLDLRTGSFQRLTYHIDWDEGGMLSPDMTTLVTGSARRQFNASSPSIGGRNAAYSHVSLPSFLDSIGKATLALYYLEDEHIRFDLLRPTMLDLNGCRLGYFGQPLRDAEDEGWDSTPSWGWGPNSDRIVWWETTSTPCAPACGFRLRRALLSDRAPSPPAAMRLTPEPTWGPRLEELPCFDTTADVVLRGACQGSARLQISAPPGQPFQQTLQVEYSGYSDEPGTVVTGRETVVGLGYLNMTYDIDVTVAGTSPGHVTGNIKIFGPSASGAIRSTRGTCQIEKVFTSTSPDAFAELIV